MGRLDLTATHVAIKPELVMYWTEAITHMAKTSVAEAVPRGRCGSEPNASRSVQTVMEYDNAMALALKS